MLVRCDIMRVDQLYLVKLYIMIHPKNILYSERIREEVSAELLCALIVLEVLSRGLLSCGESFHLGVPSDFQIPC